MSGSNEAFRRNGAFQCKNAILTAATAVVRDGQDRSGTGKSHRLANVGLGILLGTSAYILVGRPWLLHWGANPEETRSEWPGDELTPGGNGVVRAITIHASIDHVWPWLMQIGQDRGGYYSYTWLENLILADIHNVNRLIPGLSPRRVGDSVWMANPRRYGGRGRMVVAELQAPDYMVLVMPTDLETVQRKGQAPQGTWTFILEPVNDTTTRLVMRGQSAGSMSLLRFLYDRLVFEPAHFIMERKMMLTLKHLIESQGPEQDRASGTIPSRSGAACGCPIRDGGL